MELGDTVEDTISGFRGVVSALTVYLNGNRKACVEALELNDGRPIPSEWFDVHRLKVTAAAVRPVQPGFVKPCS